MATRATWRRCPATPPPPSIAPITGRPGLDRNGADYADITSSGAIDAATLGALQAFLRTRGTAAGTVLVKPLNALQGARYIALAETRPADETFLCGWLANRVA